MHSALKKGQINSEFDFRTVTILMEKYDTNKDGEISFDEFFNLVFSINNLFNEFLDYDLDSSQTIDPMELESLLAKKGYQLSRHFFEFFYRELRNRMNISKITFDIYVRISAKLDYLTSICGQMRDEIDFERFLIENFFENF